MPTQGRSGKPTTRRYSDEEKAQAVRLVHQLRKEFTPHSDGYDALAPVRSSDPLAPSASLRASRG